MSSRFQLSTANSRVFDWVHFAARNRTARSCTHTHTHSVLDWVKNSGNSLLRTASDLQIGGPCSIHFGLRPRPFLPFPFAFHGLAIPFYGCPEKILWEYDGP